MGTIPEILTLFSLGVMVSGISCIYTYKTLSDPKRFLLPNKYCYKYKNYIE